MNDVDPKITRKGRLSRPLNGGEFPLCSLQFAASTLVLVGFFSPWIGHRAAALTVTGYELSEFAKFFPQVQSGVVTVKRALFITPLFAATISSLLAVHRSRVRLPIRLAATALAVLIGLSVLPPYQSIVRPEYRLQLTLSVIGLTLTILTPLTGQFSKRIRGTMFLLLALVGSIPALWQYVLLRPLVAGLYETRILPAWGLIGCVIGLLMLGFTGLADMLVS